MKRTIGLFVLLLATLSALAQDTEGVVSYDHTYAAHYHPVLELQKLIAETTKSEWQELPTHITESRTLIFNAASSLMYPTSKLAVEPGQRPATEGSEHIDTTFVDFDKGEYTESRVFWGELFLTKDRRPDLQWQLTDEERSYLGYRVMKATAELNAGLVEAWFAPDIPIPGGAGLYGGLPGLILMVTVELTGEVYAAKSLRLGMLGVLAPDVLPPTHGKAVSDAEYYRIGNYIPKRTREGTLRSRSCPVPSE